MHNHNPTQRELNERDERQARIDKQASDFERFDDRPPQWWNKDELSPLEQAMEDEFQARIKPLLDLLEQSTAYLPGTVAPAAVGRCANCRQETPSMGRDFCDSCAPDCLTRKVFSLLRKNGRL